MAYSYKDNSIDGGQLDTEISREKMIIVYMEVRRRIKAEPYWEEHCQILTLKYSKAGKWLSQQVPTAAEIGGK